MGKEGEPRDRATPSTPVAFAVADHTRCSESFTPLVHLLSSSTVLAQEGKDPASFSGRGNGDHLRIVPKATQIGKGLYILFPPVFLCLLLQDLSTSMFPFSAPQNQNLSNRQLNSLA